MPKPKEERRRNRQDDKDEDDDRDARRPTPSSAHIMPKSKERRKSRQDDFKDEDDDRDARRPTPSSVHNMLYDGVTSFSKLKGRIKIYETTNRTTIKQSEKVFETEGSAQENKRIRCYGCGELEHASFDRPHKNKGVKWFKCNEFGHIGSTCSRRPNDRRTKKPEEAVGSNRQASDNFGNVNQFCQPNDDATRKRAMFGMMVGAAADFTSVNFAKRSDAPIMADYQSDTEGDLSMSTQTTQSEVIVM